MIRTGPAKPGDKTLAELIAERPQLATMAAVGVVVTGAVVDA